MKNYFLEIIIVPFFTFTKSNLTATHSNLLNAGSSKFVFTYKEIGSYSFLRNNTTSDFQGLNCLECSNYLFSNRPATPLELILHLTSSFISFQIQDIIQQKVQTILFPSFFYKKL